MFENSPSYYADTGCDDAKKLGYYGPCLECPFEKCCEDNKHFFKYTLRNREIYNFFLRGFKQREIAKIFRLSRLQIRRIIRKERVLASKLV
jgi:hypothetical protein